jgi:hypothetical protein
MLRFILFIIGGIASVLLFALMIRYLLKLSFSWDSRICSKLKSSFCGFRRHFRMPTVIGVLPEFLYFLVLGRDNYFNARWWALRMASYTSFLFFLAVLFRKSVVETYYSPTFFSENGLAAYLGGSSGMWYLNFVNLLFVALLFVILLESVRMHKGWAPVRFILYSLMASFMAYITIITMSLIISLTFLYICYKIIRFFMKSGRHPDIEVDDNDSPSDKLNNRYRRFRAELYEWEAERKADRRARSKKKKTMIRRKRPKIKRKPKKKYADNDIPRIHPG